MAVSGVEDSISIITEKRTRQYNNYLEFKSEMISNSSSRGVEVKFTPEVKIHTRG